MTLTRIIRDKNALEIIRNIIRETLLANGACALLISLALPMFHYSVPANLFAVVLITAAFMIFSWMACYVSIYFSELAALYPWLSKTMLFMWAIIFELSVIAAVSKIWPK
ncbi:hypothetical protein N3553_24590 [Pantoea dispersa]|uniref:hypothetical protein n=1 Tax=Pantoea dispersa TaxID=59814 RepID=UPI000FDA5664|nr:hypothetical protein [Pantoea dispersa]MCT6593042.1 hypothetical protein [Pantoea dispersa]MCW0323839.1 hypothetical protein [Pantoea dispersa]MCW0328575.1 hypothetical protein [Pantoea dispersa]MCW0435002.1 hypothetical protein [Pantoea dispersa]RVU71982.1 hypothetical protein EKH82_24290 [Pantoea dispersa]